MSTFENYQKGLLSKEAVGRATVTEPIKIKPSPPLAGRIPLDRLVWLGNVPAGMDWSVIGYWACQFRKSGEQGPPILVVPIGNTGLYRVTDGRHRTCAAYVAGRTEIAYAIDPNRPSEPNPDPLGSCVHQQ